MLESERLLAVGADGCRSGWVGAKAFGVGGVCSRIQLESVGGADEPVALVDGKPGRRFLPSTSRSGYRRGPAPGNVIERPGRSWGRGRCASSTLQIGSCLPARVLRRGGRWFARRGA